MCIRDRVTALTREGTEETTDAHAKLSAFYGPDGLLGVMLLHKAFHKVHGSEDTVMSIVY